MSSEWFSFCDPSRVADSLPDNKIVQVSSNFDSCHWLTTIRATPQDTEIEQMSRRGFAMGSFAAWDVLTLLHPLCSRAGEQLQDLLPHSSCPQVMHHWHHTQKKHSSWEAFGTVRCLEAGFRQLQP